MTTTTNTPNFTDEFNNDVALCESCRWVTPEDNGTVVAAFDGNSVGMVRAARAMRVARRCGLTASARLTSSGWLMTASR